jgi:hypothetical protein
MMDERTTIAGRTYVVRGRYPTAQAASQAAKAGGWMWARDFGRGWVVIQPTDPRSGLPIEDKSAAARANRGGSPSTRPGPAANADGFTTEGTEDAEKGQANGE